MLKNKERVYLLEMIHLKMTLMHLEVKNTKIARKLLEFPDICIFLYTPCYICGFIKLQIKIYSNIYQMKRNPVVNKAENSLFVQKLLNTLLQYYKNVVK